MSRELISKKTRIAFREYFVSTTLRRISQEFDSADVPIDSNFQPSESGERRCLVEQYYHTVDWTSPRDVGRILRVYESTLARIEDHLSTPTAYIDITADQKEFAQLIKNLEKDGYTYSNETLTPTAKDHSITQFELISEKLSGLSLLQQIDRINSSIETDPSLAIGTAKELVETVCKSILPDYGVIIDKDWDLPRLLKETRGVLKLVPEDIPDSAKGAESIKKILGNLSTLVQGLSELRNLYGTGHGRSHSAKGLSPRHAKLAVGAASTLAVFLLETHEMRRLDGLS